MTDFIEERVRLVRSLADRADPFIKRRLLMLAERYESQLASPPNKPTRVLHEIRAVTTFSDGER